MKGRACQALSSYIFTILSILFMEIIVNIVFGQIYCSEIIFTVFKLCILVLWLIGNSCGFHLRFFYFPIVINIWIGNRKSRDRKLQINFLFETIEKMVEQSNEKKESQRNLKTIAHQKPIRCNSMRCDATNCNQKAIIILVWNETIA